MLRTYSECREFNRMLESRQREAGSSPTAQRRAYNRVMQEVTDLTRAGQVELSLRNAFEATVEDGHNVLREMDEARRNRHPSVLLEAGGDAITTANFSNIIGQVSFATVLEPFEQSELVGGDLLTEESATTAQREMVPGVTKIGDQAEAVGEGEEYPLVEVGEEYVTLPKLDKQGFMVAVTEEMVLEDKTGRFMERMGDASDALAITREKERLNVTLGITSTYSRNGGPEQATYANSHTQGDFDNLVASNALVDYTDIDVALNALQDIVDPDTGEPIALGGDLQLVHAWELDSTVTRVLEAEHVRQGAISGSVPETYSPNPVNRPGRPAINAMWGRYFKEVVGNSSTWFLGNFKKAFAERVQIPLQLVVEDRNTNSGVTFSRDIIFRQKVRYKSKPGVRRPQYVVKCTA